MPNLVSVSIIIPCRNEEKFIGQCLDSIIANDYPKNRLEILVVDGMSEDRTREILDKYEREYSFIKILNNPKKITPVALNLGIKQAKGEIIMRADAHTTYEKDYVSKCLKYLDEYRADNVGGLWITVSRDDTFVGKAIALTLSHPFGAGNAYYRIGSSKEPRWVDTVPFGCYRKEIFKKIGPYNENLMRSQDMEFNLRLKKAGGKILLVPDIVSYYYPKSNLKDFFLHNFEDGIWAIYPLKFIKFPFQLRHYLPLIFVLTSPLSIWPYTLFSLLFSAQIAIREKDFSYFFLMPIAFFLRHFGYGLGSIFGLIRCLLPV